MGVLAAMSRRPWVAHSAVLVVYLLLTAILTWPMVAHFDDAVLGPPGDNLEYVWKMWWFKYALLDQRVSPMFNPDVFYPFGYPLALGETTMAHTVLGLPVTALFGEVVAYNSMMYGSFVLSGYGLYLLLRELGCGVLSALIGGMAFAFSPYRLSHLGAGHLPLMGTGWLPLLFLSLERLVVRRTWTGGLLVGLFYALTALSSWYYAVSAGLFAALYLLLRARPWRDRLWRLDLWSRRLLAGAVSAVLIAPAMVPLLRLVARGEMRYDGSLKYIDQWSASPMDFLYPNAMHSLWGEAATVRYYQNPNEHLLYLGLVALSLAAIGLWSRRGERLPRVFAILGGVGLVLALGTTLHYAGEPVYIRVSSGIEYQFSRAMYTLTSRYAFNKVDYSPLRQEKAIVIPLPMLLLYLFVPGMKAMRVWARFGLLSMFAVAVLCGWGAKWVLSRIGRPHGRAWQVLAATVLGSLLLFDFAVLPYPYGYTEVRAQPVDLWLARQSAGTPIVQYPLERNWYGWMLYPTRVHGHPIAYGYGSFAPSAYLEMVDALDDWPSEHTLALLRSWGVKHVLVGARSYGEQWPAIQSALAALPALEEVAVFEDQPVFHGDRLLELVRPSASVPATELIGGKRRAYLQDEVHVYAIK